MKMLILQGGRNFFPVSNFCYIIIRGYVRMRKFFLHNWIVKLFALIALTLAVISFASPKVQRYNEYVSDEQKRLKIEANGKVTDEIIFSNDFSRESFPDYYAEITMSLGLFLCLIFTKRIIFSLFSAFLFITQFIILLQLLDTYVEFPMSYFVNAPILGLLWSIIGFILAIWQTTIICRILSKIFGSNSILK